MTNVDFRPSPELAIGLARSASDGRQLFELVMPRRPIWDDLSAIPYFAPGPESAEKSSLFRCDKCAGGKVMMTGKPSVILCRSCDDAKIRKRVLRWEEARITPRTT